MGYPRQPGLTREGPTQGEQQIIGVELAVSRDGRQEVELDMFQCKHTIPRGHLAGRDQVRITIHTSDGDVTILSSRGFQPGTYYVQ